MDEQRERVTKVPAKRAKPAKSIAPKSRRAPAAKAPDADRTARRASSPPSESSATPAPVSMDPRTTLRDHPGQRSLAKAARVATASLPPSRREDDISIPPTSGDPPSDLDERFFAEGEAAARGEEFARKHPSAHPRAHADDFETRRPALLIPPERRQRLMNYVKAAVGFSAVLCLAALARYGLSHGAPPSMGEHGVVAAQIAVPAVPSPIQPVAAAPAPVPAPPAAAAPAAVPSPVPPPAPTPAVEEAVAVAEPATPTKSAKEEKEGARAALERGKRQDAIDAAGRSVALDPTDAEAWLILGSAQQDSGHWKEGREAYSECTKQAKVGPIGECRMMLR